MLEEKLMPRKYEDLSTLAERNLDKVQVTTLKRYNEMAPLIRQAVEEESERLYQYIAGRAINVQANPYKLYSKKAWRPLNKRYAKRKGHSNFWYKTGLLERWLRSKKPSSVYGKPRVELQKFNRFARGLQRLTLRIIPYPKENISIEEKVYNRLYAQKKVKLGNSLTFISNEDDRPIVSPAKKLLIRYRINRTVSKTVKEILSYGKK